jgi:hypothetical protein
MVAYNYSLGGTAAKNGSGAGLNRISCRADLFGGTDLPYNNTQLTGINSAPGTESGGSAPNFACATALNLSAVPPPFGPPPPGGVYAPPTDQTITAMNFPIAGGAVAIATNTNGVCPLPTPTGLMITSNEFDHIWQGSLNEWTDPALLATNPGLNTTADVAQTLPAATLTVVSTAGFPATGSINVVTSTGTQTLTYTGLTATSFTGVAGGSAASVAAGAAVSLPPTTTDVAQTLPGLTTTVGAQSLPTGTLTVTSTASFPSSGTLEVASSTGTQTLTYTGTTATTFTGVTGGTGNITAGAAVAGVGTVTVNNVLPATGTTGFPSSGALTIALSGGGTATLRYTGTTATSFTGVTTDTAAGTISAGASIANTSPLAGCTWSGGQIQRVVRQDNSGTTGITMQDLGGGTNGTGVFTGIDTGALCDTATSGAHGWNFYFTQSPNTSWPAPSAACADGSGHQALTVSKPATSGSPALIALTKATNGAIGYAELGLWGGFTATPSISFATIESQSATASAGIGNNTPPGGSFISPGNPGAKSACNPGALGLPGAAGANQAVGLGGQNFNWANDNPNSGANKENITYSGAGYPLCGLTFDFVYTGLQNQAGEVANPVSGTPGCKNGPSTTLGFQTVTADTTQDLTTATTLSVDSTAGFPANGSLSVVSSTGTQTLTYTGTTTTSFTGLTPAAGLGTVGTDVAVTSANSETLPEGTVPVVSTAAFPATGTITVVSSTGTQTLTYTGKTATSFTGVTGGTGTITEGALVGAPGVVNGACQTVQGPEIGTTNDQLRTLYSFFTYVFSPLGQSYLDQATYDEVPGGWLPALRAGYQNNF